MNAPVSFRRDSAALLTPRQMGEADRAAEAAGCSGSALMEAAGEAVAVAIGGRWSMRPVTIVCGPGGNGGDGFVVARHLAAAGWPVKVALLGSRDRLAGDAARAAKLWPGRLDPFTPACLDGAGVVVDAIFGAGLARAVDGPALSMIEAMTSGGIPI
jgi:NAD(P)H-hydrate epimerase